MRWNKITGLLLLALTGAALGLTGVACQGKPRTNNNLPNGVNNLSVNVYNGYPGNSSNNANDNVNVKIKGNVKANSNANINVRTINGVNKIR